MLINKDGSVNPALVSLVRIQGITVPDGLAPAGLNDLLQREWVKAKDGTVRAELGGRFPTDPEMDLLNQLGAAAIHINFDVLYDGTLLLGATLKAVTRRMKFMLDAELDPQRRFRQHPIPQPVYYLASHRPIDPKQEMTEHVLAILGETGAQFNNTYLKDAQTGNWPVDEEKMLERLAAWIGAGNWYAARSVAAPNVTKLDGSARPANTAETVKHWLEIEWMNWPHGKAKQGHYLIVSSQPFCEGQKMAVERAVKEAGKEGYTFDVCGPATPALPLSRWLDNLAKQLWEEVQLLPK